MAKPSATGLPLRMNFSVSFPGFALTVSEMLPPGQIVCLFGPSGSGKTTTLRAIAGLEPGVEGEISLGEDVWHKRRRNRRAPHKRGIGYVVQGGALFPHRTVRGNLDFVAKRAGTRGAPFETVVKDMGLGPLLDRRLSGLSGGERQRVALGQALLRAPRVLLLDEPLAALDAATKAALIPALRRGVLRQACPTLLVSHDPSEVRALADHVLWIEAGSIVEEGGFPDGHGGVALPVAGRVEEVFAQESRLSVGSLSLILPGRYTPGSDVRVLLPEAAVMVGNRKSGASSAMGQGFGTLRGITPAEGRPGQVQLEIDCGGARVTARLAESQLEALGPEIGKTLRVDVLDANVLGG